MTDITISQIEAAINYWCKTKPDPAKISLCDEARLLADVYGGMIFSRQSVIADTTLNDAQRAALRMENRGE